MVDDLYGKKFMIEAEVEHFVRDDPEGKTYSIVIGNNMGCIRLHEDQVRAYMSDNRTIA